MNTIILKLGHTNVPQESSEGVLISKISSSLTPLSLLYLVKTAQNKINPRTATVNQITTALDTVEPGGFSNKLWALDQRKFYRSPDSTLPGDGGCRTTL